MKKPAGKSGRRHLDDDEAADWDHTAKTIEPLKRSKSRVRAARENAIADIPPRQTGDVAAVAGRGRVKLGTAAGAVKAMDAPQRKTVVPPIAEFDRKNAKKLRSGRVEIEARLDLHGMRQDEAHGALRSFLHRAQGRGQRWVLVITGKGGIASRADDSGDDVMPVRDRGVLKRNVPRWLEEPELRALVVSFTVAAQSHGGDGALYVHLRKKG